MNSHHKNGFTLVELLIAVMILSVTISGVLLLYVTSMVSSQLAWDKTVATTHAQYVLEEAQTHDTIEKVKQFNWQGWAKVQRLNTLPEEKIDVALKDLSPRLLDVAVTVRWERNARAHEVLLKTKLAK